ncbi:MAG: hypothetical protein JXX28_10165 [Deltaproteobacteria bacterium]|nr:hypothetical protein [Deltaproteobacteria bacterium]
MWIALLLALACGDSAQQSAAPAVAQPSPPPTATPAPVAPTAAVAAPNVEETAPPTGPDDSRWTITARGDEALPELAQEGLSAQDLNAAGHRYYQAGDLYAATRLFQAAVALDEEHALAHYNLACTLAIARRIQGSACGVIEAYQGVILHHLERAVALDEGRRARMVEDEDLAGLRGLIRFKVLAGADLRDTEATRGLLLGAHLVDEPQGAFGSLRHLQLDASGRYAIRWTAGARAANDGKLPGPEPSGRWVVRGDKVELQEGPQRTELRLLPTGALVTDDKVVWTEDPAECDA